MFNEAQNKTLFHNPTQSKPAASVSGRCQCAKLPPPGRQARRSRKQRALTATRPPWVSGNPPG